MADKKNIFSKRGVGDFLVCQNLSEIYDEEKNFLKV